MKFDQKKYWLGPDAEVLACDYPRGVANNHLDIALDYLDRQAVEVPNMKDANAIYGELFKRGSIHVTEVPDLIAGDALHADNDGRCPTVAQRDYLLSKQQNGFAVKLNRKPINEVLQAAPDETMGSAGQ